MKRFGRYLGWIALFLLVSCGETMLPAVGAPTPSLPPGGLPTPTPAWPPEAQALLERAVADLAGRVGASPGQVEVVRVEQVAWPDSCLGCAPKGQACATVVVPGFRFVLRAGGQEYEYRSDEKEQVMLCPTETTIGDWGPAQPLVEAVVADLAGRLNLPPEQIRVVQVEERMWPDSSLGCPRPGEMYLQVITPGYRILLEAGGRQYDYHTGSQAHFVLCEK
ncbi:MAG: hypothetical protein ACP5OO_11615 [Chloroflexia bacterium]